MSLIPRIRLVVVLALALSCLQCQTGANGDLPPKKPEPPSNAPAARYGYQIVNMWPHDSNAFTQGLILSDGKLLESTGQEGFSSLRRVDLDTGKILKKVDVPKPYFAEGIALLNGKIYQLTWQLPQQHQAADHDHDDDQRALDDLPVVRVDALEDHDRRDQRQ